MSASARRRKICLVTALTLTAALAGLPAGAQEPEPRFTFGPETQEVVGLDWPVATPVTMTIDDPSTATAPDHEATMTPSSLFSYESHLNTGWGGNVYFDLVGSYEARPGDVITLTNNTTTKTLVVPALTSNVPDPATETFSGSTTPGDSVVTVVSDAWWAEGHVQHEVTPAADGTWSWTFTDADLTTGTITHAVQTDADGDMTETLAPQPTLFVDPAADRVWAIDFTADPVTLTIVRAAETMLSEAVTRTNVLTHGSWNLDMWSEPTGTLPRPAVALFDLAFDIRAGDVLTVSDGVSTRTLTTALLTVGSVSAATDVISGLGTDGDVITLHLGDGETGYWGYSTTVTAGAWSLWFDPDTFPFQGLEPGMTGQAIVQPEPGAAVPSTVVRWTVPSGPSEPTELLAAVETLDLTRGVERELTATLASAQRAFDKDRDAAGVRLMTAFITKVSALTPRVIPTAAADALIADAQAVIAAHS